MTDLKRLFEELGFINVKTYIQSGNVVFETDNSNSENILESIKNILNKKYIFSIDVMILAKQKLLAMLKKDPFPEVNPSQLLVTLFSSIPQTNLESEIKSKLSPGEELLYTENEMYLHCPNGYGKTKLTNSFLEKKLMVMCTTRNWRTLRKLKEMTDD